MGGVGLGFLMGRRWGLKGGDRAGAAVAAATSRLLIWIGSVYRYIYNQPAGYTDNPPPSSIASLTSRALSKGQS